MSVLLTAASDDASRVATRVDTWTEQMQRLALAQLADDLDTIATTGLGYQARAIVATSYIDGAAERLRRLGAA